MVADNISDEVKKFIYKYIESLAELEILLFFYNNQSQSYDSHMIAIEMRNNPHSVLMTMKVLNSYDFLILDDPDNKIYSYNRGNKDDSCIRQINSTYINYRHSLITLIFSRPSDSIRSFADAFKFKKDKDNG